MYWKESMTTWVDHFMMCTQSNDETVVIQFIQQHNGNVDQTILTWQRETDQAQSRGVWDIQSDTGAAGGLSPREKRGGPDNLSYTSQPQSSPPAAWSPLQIGSHQEMLDDDEERDTLQYQKPWAFCCRAAPSSAACHRSDRLNVPEMQCVIFA